MTISNKYHNKAVKLAKLVTEKQAAYGDAFGKMSNILTMLYPEGIKPNQYRDLLTIVRTMDKIFRIATKKDAFGESPWDDVLGYALLAAVIAQEEKDEKYYGPNNVLIKVEARSGTSATIGGIKGKENEKEKTSP